MQRILWGTLIAALVASGCQCGGAPQTSLERLDPAASKVEVDRSADVVADGQDTVKVTVTVLDLDGKPMPDLAVTLAVSGEGNVLTQPAVTDSQGVTVGSFTSTRAGLKTITATVGDPDGVSLDAQPTVTFVAGAAAALVFDVPPGSVQAGATFAPPVQVAVRDASGNLVSGSTLPIALTLEGGPDGATLQGTSAQSATDGVALFSDLSIETAGAGYRLVAAAEGLSAAQSPEFEVTVGAPAKLRFVSQPQDAVAGATLTPPVQVQVVDDHGNPIGDSTAEVSLALTGASVQLDGTTTVAAAGGVATFADLSVATAGEGYTLSASATGFAGAQSAAFSVAPGSISTATSTLVAAPDHVLADGAASSTLSFTARDALGNGIPDLSVTLASSGGSADTLAPASAGTTDATGVFNASITSTLAGERTITATFDGGAIDATITFDPGAPEETTSTLTVAPSPVTADGTSAATATVTALDAFGNPVPNAPVALTVTGSATVLPASGTTDSTGVFTANVTSTVAETVTVGATVGTFTLSQPLEFVPGAPDAMRTTFVASPTSLTADGVAASALTVIVADAQGNAIPNEPVAFGVSGSNNIFPATALTDSTGTAVASLTSTRAEAKTVTATVGTFSLPQVVTFVPGAPDPATSTFTATPNTVTADNAATSSLTVVVVDAFGNPIAGQAVSLSASGSNNVFTPSTGSTDGQGTFTATLASSKAELKTITADVGGLFSLPVNVTFVAGPPVAAESTFTAAPGSVVADGSSTSTLTATLRDAFSNPVEGQTITVASSGTGNTLQPATGATDGAGTFTATLSSTRAEVKSLSADVGGLFTLTASVTFVAGSPAQASSTFTAAPSSLTVGASSNLTVTVLDAQGNPVAGQGVVLASTGTGNTFTPSSGTTNGAGVFTSQLSSTKAEAKTVTATVAAAFPLTANLTFNAGSVSATNSSVTATPISVQANGTDQSTITVIVRDGFGNPLSGQTVLLGATGSGNLLAQPAGTTDTNGTISGALASTVPEPKTVSATVNGVLLTDQPQVTFSNEVEGFENVSPWPWAPWTSGRGGPTGNTSAACAHSGGFGIMDPDWFYRTDVAVGAPGQALSVWVLPSSNGRAYLGFGATSAGAWSFVLAPNTSQLIFQQNGSYGFVDVSALPATFTTGAWHRMEVTFGSGGQVTGRVYAADGTTLLQTLNATLPGLTTGGIALRSFGSFCMDELVVQ